MKFWKLTLLLLIVGSLALTGCSDDDDDIITPQDPPELDYAGSDACGSCHATKHTNWTHSGHPYKLMASVGDNPPTGFPDPSRYFQDDIDPPHGTPWSDYSYTIGGYGWKMRWIKNDGYIYTPDEGGNQYNFENGLFSDYNAGADKQYDCGSCHTTGWEDSNDGNAENNQDGMEGMWGTFVYGGIHCESCHGMANQHVFDPETYLPLVDDSSLFCGKCHSRGGDNGVSPGETIIEASSGYISHHEQYDEWFNSPHNSTYGPGCVTCHDPHSSVKFDATAPGDGVNVDNTCVSCHVTGDHANIASTNHNGAANCVNCHMPDASKSAIANSLHKGDVSTHLWTINTSINGKVDMFNADGSAVLLNDEGYGAVTLDFACYGCHADENGEGGTALALTMQQLVDRAEAMHTYVGVKVAEK